MSRFPAAGAAFIALTLAGCAGGQSLLSDNPPAALSVAMEGRWILAAPDAPVCGMMFSDSSEKSSGTIVPEGGCPERFFLSRSWSRQQDALTINDDEENAIATLTFAAGRFEGQSTAGTPVTLTR